MDINQYILVLSFVIALIIFYLRKKDVLPYFLVFLLISIVYEFTIGNDIEVHLKNRYTAYSIFGSMTITYYLFLYLREIVLKKVYVFFLIMGFLVFSFLNMFFIQGLYRFNNLSYNLGIMMVILSVFLYLKKIVIHAQTRKLASMPLFWLGLGLISFYCSVFPILIFSNRLMELDIEFATALFDIVRIGNIFLALSFVMVSLCPILIKN